ncbi:glycosyltransferase family 2 protein [Xenorhabdus sp. 18]|uniref:glycosyltransferase family 2 protein n=1 Tax=Xenorhabdus doucetiae TaxID=351671 RepID=UPI0019AC40C2|nr:glycosyltransferase family 2 protein [Xenorhabdus sp. 18]MBD2795652.1 glycosyltransferase family 2 protein [Xenorhabdus sp. 18]
MVYVIVLNWNGAEDTISCVKSLLKSNYNNYNIIVVDNKSTDNSYFKLKNELSIIAGDTTYFSEVSIENIKKYKCQKSKEIILIQSGANLGYSGGNNVGILFALNQADMEYVWILNNDTEIHSSAIEKLVMKCKNNSEIGICGSRLIIFDDRTRQQSLGGIHNKWLCTTKQYAWMQSSSVKYNDNEVAEKIDYVVGAAMFFTKRCLIEVGLLSEDYFLYFEELDICLRAKSKGFLIGVCSESRVYHKEGASTGGGKSNLADYCSIRNRLIITRKFFPKFYIFVWLSLFGVAINRARRKEFNKMKTCLRIMFNINM